MFLTVILLTPFTFLISSLSTVTRGFIFDFNSTNLLIIFLLNSSFFSAITFLLTGSKKFESSALSLKSNKLLPSQKSFVSIS